MDLVSPIWSLVSSSWDRVSKHKDYICKLEQNLTCLIDKMNELNCIHRDVSLKVALAETNPRMVRGSLVHDWLTKVESIQQEVNAIHQQGQQEVHNSCLSGCFPSNCRSRYKLGKQVMRYIGQINSLRDKGQFDVVAFDDSLTSLSVENKVEGLTEILTDEIVGMETTFEVVWDCVCDETTLGIIGLYGMGGVGKTTLLKKLNNELLNKGSLFDLVIWVVASKGASVEAVQDTILRKLCIATELWRGKEEHEKANQVFRFLKVRRFIVMLDDLWENLDVVRVGIPLPSALNKCKIVFTTRSEEVCGQMGARKSIKVRCLTKDEAWCLFQEKVGENALSSHSDIPRLAREACMECDGLPLALITIGRAMASRKNPYEWEHAIQVLKSYPSKFSGMADHVLGVLKFSFDSLSDETVKLCFLYCSIFPEDYQIVVQDLVDLWVGEGYLNDFRAVPESRNYGLYIVETLKLACLLEVGQSELHVKMHDVIRDMALWIACENGSKKTRFLIQEQCFSTENHDRKKQEGVERVSVWGNSTKQVLQYGYYPCLLTALIRQSWLTRLPGGFFQFTGKIRVLDLSGNKHLKELPEAVGNLVTLQYLNISGTELTALPKNLRNLIDLRYLLMDYMTCLEEVSPEIISGFSYLRVFRMNYGHMHNNLEPVIVALESLQFISEISIYICCTESSKKLKSSSKLQQCMRNLRIDSCENVPTFELLSPENLETLHIYNTSLTQVVNHPSLPSHTISLLNLQSVVIYRCSEVINLNFMDYAPNIQTLWVSYCKSLKEVISETVITGGVSFSRLKNVRLDNLPCLTCIYPSLIPTPSLEQVYIFDCPLLKKLPFIPERKQLRRIRTEHLWFRGLVWDDETAKQCFGHQFKSVGLTNTSKGLKIERYWPETLDLFLTRIMEESPFEYLPAVSRETERRQLLWACVDTRKWDDEDPFPVL